MKCSLREAESAQEHTVDELFHGILTVPEHVLAALIAHMDADRVRHLFFNDLCKASCGISRSAPYKWRLKVATGLPYRTPPFHGDKIKERLDWGIRFVYETR